MDSRAVSALIGFVLMLAIIMGFIGIVQSRFVPEWNKAVEARHLDKLSYEVADLSEAVSMAASTGNPAKVVIDAGVEYPEYYVLVSPSKAAAAVSAERLRVVVNGEMYTSYAVVVEPQYLYSARPKFVYEHSAVFRLENSNIVVDSEQSSFTGGKITIYLINATFNSFSTTENVNIMFYPVSYGGVTHYDSLTITFESYNDETARWWEDELKSLGFSVSRSGRNVTVTASDVDLSVDYLVAYATTGGGVGVNPYTGPLRILNLSEQSYNVYRGTTIPLGVRVVDKFNNPARNVAVSITDSCHGSTSRVTDNDGEVWYYFSASDSGGCEVRFSIPDDSFTYQITVSSAPSGGGIFDVVWNASRYDWNVSQVGYEKKFKVTVSYNGNRVGNINVDIAADNMSVVSVPAEVTTNSAGECLVDLWAMKNGTANVFASVGGSVGILELTITGAGACHGWSYWREITITNSLDHELTDYQIKVELNSSNFDFSHTKSDGSDIRFYDSDRVTPLSYWIEEWDSGHAVIWVKVSSIPSGSKTIYMYYGNPLASSESNVSKVFIPGKIAMFAYDWRNEYYGAYADSHYEFQGAINSNPSKLHSEYVETLNWIHSGDSNSGAFGSFPFRSYDFMTLFKFLLVPGERSIQQVATDSDDASEILIGGTVTAYWYGGHAPSYSWRHNAVVNVNKPVWVEYRQQEWYGIEAARMAIKFSGDGNWYVIDANSLPYNTKIFARKYAETEPSVSIGAEHQC